FCMSHPIAISDRDAWIKTGRFPGEVAAPVPPSAAVQAAAMLSSPAAQIGDNSKGTEADPLKLIKMEFDDYAATVREFIAKAERAGGIKTKPDADQAANMADMIGKNRGGIARRADDARKEANAPLQAEI